MKIENDLAVLPSHDISVKRFSLFSYPAPDTILKLLQSPETQRIKYKRKLLLLLEFPQLLPVLSPPKILLITRPSPVFFLSMIYPHHHFLLESSLSFVGLLSVVALRF